MIPKESPKQESASTTTTTTTIATTTATWSRLKDPRIVRVARAMGGKDRHSKVCTVRGLRDRRVRLSVPTAIQLYDLQERLGLSQPSKVVDWLLDAARSEIDELPPLQIPEGIAFSQMRYPSLNKHEKNVFVNQEQQHEDGHNQLINLHQNPPSFPGLFGHEGFQHQQQHQHQHQHQLLFCQSSGMLAQPYFVPQVNTDHYTKQPGFHSLDLSSSSASSLSVRPPFDFNINANLLPSQSKQA